MISGLSLPIFDFFYLETEPAAVWAKLLKAAKHLLFFQKISLQGNTVEENLNSEEIGTFQTFDEDSSDRHTIAMVVNPSNRFVVVNNTLYTSSTADLDYEAQQSWSIRIKSTDNGTPPLSVEESFLLEVIDVNEAPEYIGLKGKKVFFD